MFKALLKKQFIETFAQITTSRKSGKAKGTSKVLFILLYLLCFVSLMFAFFGVSDAIGSTILPFEEIRWLYYTLLALMALALSVVGSAFSSYTALYNARDNELLLSMPIPPVYILITRMVVVFVLGFAFEFIVLVPAMIRYWMIVGPTFLNVISPIIAMLLLAFIALALSCVLGWLVALIASRVKNKNAATVIFTIVFLALYYVFYFNAQKLLSKLIANIDNMKFPVHIIGSAFSGNILSLAILFVISAIIFVAMCYVLSKSFVTLVTRKVAEKKVVYTGNTEVKKTSIAKALRKKELKRFLGSPVYMLNSGLGIIMMPAAAIILLIKRSALQPFLAIAPVELLEVGILAAVVMFASMCIITAPSISLEGNNFWIERVLPIKSYDIINSKIELHVFLAAPPAIIMAIVLCIVCNIEIMAMVQIAAALYCVIIVQAQIGIALNLKMPNMDWTNEAVPVKRSLPTVICMFGDWIFGAIIFFGFYFLNHRISSSIYLYVVLIAMVLISRVLGKWLRTRGVELLETL